MVSRPRTLKRILPTLGLALIAALALSAVGVASASAAEPENTVSPVVTASPHVGIAATTTNGTWTGSPTSYAYVWFRCNASGVECKSISGATKSSYTPVAADVGKTLLTSVTASNGEGSGIALSKPSGVLPAPLPHWYACQKTGEGPFSDSTCNTEGGAKTYNLVKVTETAKKVVMKNTTGINLKWSIGGTTVTVSCSTLTGEGTILNPSGGILAGTASVPTFNLGSCTVSEPKDTCKVAGGGEKISQPFKGEATEFEGKPAVKFTPSSGAVLFSIFLEGCKVVTNMNYQIEGSFTATMNNATSSLEFTKAGSSMNYKSLTGASIEGTSTIEVPGVEGAPNQTLKLLAP